jgi:tetratricopeptide (TPR) repeat protein
VDDGWPAVVVSGFEAAGADMDEVALEMGDELARELGRYRTVRVLRQRDLVGHEPAAAASSRFALEGRARREDGDVRITARLVDVATGEQVWGDEYHTSPRPEHWTGSPHDVARVVAARVAAEDGLVIQRAAAERRRRGSPPATAYDAILQAYEFFLVRDEHALAPAVDALRRAVDREPDRALCWTLLARLYLANHAFELTSLRTPLEDAITFAHRGVRVDPTGRAARCMLATALLVKGELAAGRDEAEEALRASPGSLVYLDIIGFLLTMLGDWERGPSLSRSARERNPHCLPHVAVGLWADALRRGDLEQAYHAALEYRDTGLFWRPLMRASSLGLLGRMREARSEVVELLSRKPGFRERGHVLIGHYVKFAEVLSPIVEGLAGAGLTLA